MGNDRSSYPHPDGYPVPRVTSIIGQLDKPALTYWAAGCAVDFIMKNIPEFSNTKSYAAFTSELFRVCERARKEFRSVGKEAADIGTEVHEAIKVFVDTGIEPSPKDDRVLAGFLAFLEWMGAHHLKILATEQTLYGMGYAGTCDLIAEVDSIPYILDFKTSKQPRDNKAYYEWRLQLAAYRAAWNRVQITEPDMIHHTGIIRLDKESGFPDFYDTSDDYEAHIQAFYALTVHWWTANARAKGLISHQPRNVMSYALADLIAEVYQNKEEKINVGGKSVSGAGKGKTVRPRRTRSKLGDSAAGSGEGAVQFGAVS